jgi:PAS domain S-box-containing protein
MPFTQIDPELFFDLSEDWLCVLDAEGRFQYLNAACQRGLGQPLMAQRLTDWVAPEDRAASLAALDSLRNGESRVMFQTRFKDPAGWRWLRWQAAAVADAGDLYFYCRIQEITASVQAEQRLRQLQQDSDRFQAIFNQTFQFIGLLDPQGILLEANQTALAFGGMTPPQVLGKPFWEAPWWGLSAEIQAQLKHAIATAAQGEFVR